MKINLIKYNTFILCLYIINFFLIFIFEIFNLSFPILVIFLILLIPAIFKEKLNKFSLGIILFFILIIIETIRCIPILETSVVVTYIKSSIGAIILIFYINLKISLRFLKKNLKYFLFLNSILLIITLVNEKLYENLDLDYMGWGYSFLPIVLFFAYYFQETLKYRYLIINLILLLLLFLFGSRFGALIGFVGSIFFLYRSKSKIVKYNIILGFIFSPFLIFNLKFILLKIFELLKILNLSTVSIIRLMSSLDKFTRGSDISSGRNRIYAQTIETIKNNLLFGNGLFGYIGNIDYRNRDNTFYPHNIFLEILLNFGMVGLIIFFILIFFIIRKIYLEKKKGYKIDSIYFVFVITSLKLLLSHTYLRERFFLFALLIPFNRSFYKKIISKKNYEEDSYNK